MSPCWRKCCAAPAMFPSRPRRNPHEVCELHRKHRYDLILLDLQMPGMDGFQVMEGLKEIETDGYLPVLVITAQPDHKLRALKAGAKDFVSKPFDLAEVLMRVHNMLEVRLLHLEMRRRERHRRRYERNGGAQSEQAIRASELRYRRLFETAQDGILILDADTGQVVDANPFMKDLLGYSQEEFLGKKLWEIGPFKGAAASKIAFAELQHADRIRYEGAALGDEGRAAGRGRVHQQRLSRGPEAAHPMQHPQHHGAQTGGGRIALENRFSGSPGGLRPGRHIGGGQSGKENSPEPAHERVVENSPAHRRG